MHYKKQSNFRQPHVVENKGLPLKIAYFRWHLGIGILFLEA
jgi:hypothetical protein